MHAEREDIGGESVQEDKEAPSTGWDNLNWDHNGWKQFPERKKKGKEEDPFTTTKQANSSCSSCLSWLYWIILVGCFWQRWRCNCCPFPQKGGRTTCTDELHLKTGQHGKKTAIVKKKQSPAFWCSHTSSMPQKGSTFQLEQPQKTWVAWLCWRGHKGNLTGTETLAGEQM